MKVLDIVIRSEINVDEVIVSLEEYNGCLKESIIVNLNDSSAAYVLLPQSINISDSSIIGTVTISNDCSEINKIAIHAGKLFPEYGQKIPMAKSNEIFNKVKYTLRRYYNITRFIECD